MYEKSVGYGDIFNGSLDIPETLDKYATKPDSYIAHDLIILFKMNEIYGKIDNFVEIQENKLDKLDAQLYYMYNEFGERNDYEYRNKRSKNVLENAKRKKEITLIKEKDKIDMLLNIKQKNFIVDKIKFLNENNVSIICLSAVIGGVDTGYDNEDEDTCVFVFPEFILNTTGNIQQAEDDDVSLELNLDQIKEIIVNETKYIFLC